MEKHHGWSHLHMHKPPTPEQALFSKIESLLLSSGQQAIKLERAIQKLKNQILEHELQKNWSCFQVTVTTEPTRVVEVPKKDQPFLVELANLDSTVTLFYDQDERVTTASGFPLFPQESVKLAISQDLYAIANTNVDIRIKKFKI